MLKASIQALRMFIVMTVLTGVAYPLLVTLGAQAVLPVQANGSLVQVNNQTVGSSLIGQPFSSPKYFWGRPSAVNYGVATDGTFAASGGSNLGPTSADLAKAVADRAAAFRAANGLGPDVVVPDDMLFASGSGLDPHISPAAARLQVNRVAQARGLNPDAVTLLLQFYIEQPTLDLLGQPRVNVLRLNLALDALK